MRTSESQGSSSEPKRRNRSQLGLLVLLLLLGGGVVVWRTVTSTSDPAPAEMAQGMPPTTVETVTLKRGEGVRRIQLLGQVEASKSATLRTQTAGTVEKVFVEVGDRIKPGMTIAKLDDADQQLALAEATAGPTREEIAAQQASVAAASAVNQAQLTLARTQVKTPTNGIVRSREVSAGDLVESRDPVLTLVNSNELDVFLELPEQLSGSITPGLPVELTARAIPNWQRRATITGVVPAANAASRRQMVRVRLQNPPQNLLPKMAIAAELQLQVDPNSFVVPRDALVQRDETWLVYTVANGKAAQVQVKLVVDMGETMAISSSQLQTGQPVVVRGGEALMHGAPVQVAEQNTRPES